MLTGCSVKAIEQEDNPYTEEFKKRLVSLRPADLDMNNDELLDYFLTDGIIDKELKSAWELDKELYSLMAFMELNEDNFLNENFPIKTNEKMMQSLILDNRKKIDALNNIKRLVN